MTSLRALLATALLLSMVGCGTEGPGDGRGPAKNRRGQIKADDPAAPDGGAGDTGTVTFTATATATATSTVIGTVTLTTTTTSSTTQVATSTETTLTTDTTTSTATSTQTVPATATETITTTRTATGTVTETHLHTATATATGTGTQPRTITQSTTETRIDTVTLTTILTDTVTSTISQTQTQTRTSSDTGTATGTLTTVLTATGTYVLTGTVAPTNTATVSNVSWPKNQGRTVTKTTTQFLLGTASKVVTATVTSTWNDTETKTITVGMTGTGTASGTAVVTATATRTVGSTYYGAGSKTRTSTGTASGTGSQTWTYHPTGTITETLTGIATETLTTVDTRTDTITSIINPIVTMVGTGTATFTSAVTDTVTTVVTRTDTSTETTTPTITDTTTVTGTVTHPATGIDTITITTSATATAINSSTSTHVETVTGTGTTTGTGTGTVIRTDTVTTTVTDTATITSCVPGYTGPGVIDGSVSLGASHQMEQLAGVWCITGDFWATGASTTDLGGLESLAVVAGTVALVDNPSLVSVEGMRNLRSAGRLNIFDNPALTSLAGLASLRSLGMDPWITGNSVLPACWAFEIARQTHMTCSSCTGNSGTGGCGGLPEGFVCEPGASGPGVLEGDVTIDSTRSGLSDFGGVTCITGSLNIGTSNLTDLAGLESLVAVAGGVNLTGNPALTSLNGLGNLKSAGTLTIVGNPVLTSLAGLAGLRSLGQVPGISYNPMLPACWGWEIARQTNTESFNCYNNWGTGSCGTLPEGFVCQPGATGPGVVDRSVTIYGYQDRVTDWGGVTCITGDVSIAYTNFVDLTGLDTLVAVGGAIEIRDNPLLTTVHGLENLKSARSLTVQTNPALTSLGGLAGVRTLSQGFSINDNPALPACWAWEMGRQTGWPNYGWGNLGAGSCGTLPEGFVCEPGATGPGVLDVSSLSLMGPLNQFGGVTCITGNLSIAYTNLADLTGLDTLVAVGGAIEIRDNPLLTTVHGLENLKSARSLTVQTNPALTSLGGLAGVRTLSQGFSINDNPALPACWAWEMGRQTGWPNYGWGNLGAGSCGTLPEGFVCEPGATGPGVLDVSSLSLMGPLNQFGGVTCITGNLSIAYTNLADLTGLDTLVAVGGAIEIRDNPLLTTVHGLENLKSARSLTVQTNPALTSLGGLAGVRTLSQGFSINDNPALPACWAWEMGRQTGWPNYGWGNLGAGSCGTLPEGFVCEPGATGPGVLDVSSLSLMGPLNQFGGVTCITGNLSIAYTNLADLTGLDTLVAVGGAVEIRNNPSLTSVHGLENLKSARSLSVQTNPALTSLGGLAGVRTLSQGFSINDNPALPACWAWEIGRQTGWPNYGWGNLGAGSCGTLPEGFVCEPGATGPGVLDVSSLSLMGPLNQFGGVTCITGNLSIVYTNLADLTGLDTLVAVGGAVEIRNNPSLTSVHGLENLKSARSLTVQTNPALTSLAGLSGVRTLSQGLMINDNEVLPSCWAEALAQQVGQSCSCWNNNGTETCP